MATQKKNTKKKETLEKAIYVKASKEFVDMLNESQWHLQMRPAQIVREAVIEYLLQYQKDDDRWSHPGNRPPSSGSERDCPSERI